MVVWDDGDDLHAEPRAPYPHVREVAALRAHQSGAALILGGYARTRRGRRAASSAASFSRSPPTGRRCAGLAPRMRASSDAVSDR